jgi:lipid A 3-O-deacylase
MEIWRSRALLALLSSGIGVASLTTARAADVSTPAPDLLTPTPGEQPTRLLPLPTPTYEADSFEVRFGGFTHAAGSTEAGGFDVNAELLLPRLPNTLNLPEQWQFLIPRPQFGAMIDTVGKTSYGYAGVVWTVNLLPSFFLEPMFGGAIHDGNATAVAVPDENTLGCRVLFHTGMSGGYRLTEHWTALVTWDHISNGHLCGHNAGLNDYGAKIGYTF